MLTLPVLIVAAMVAAQDPTAAQAQPPPQSGTRQQFDQTINVPKGTRVELRDCIGEVVVKTWNRESVQVKADGVRRTADVKVALTEKVLAITVSPTQWPTGVELVTVDFTLMVPAWIDLHLEGRECGIAVDGVAGSVTVKNTDGDIVLRGIGGAVDAYSIDGDIVIDGGRGKVKAGSSDGDVTISNAAGEVIVESIDGDVRLSELEATAVNASTVDGNIEFTSPFQATGKYRFTSHDGDVTLGIPETSSATFTIRTYQGDLRTTLPIKPVGEVRRGRRATYTLGAGAAQVEVETFDGGVYIKKAGTRD